MPCKAGSAKRECVQFQSDDHDLLRANTSHLRIMSKGALAAWIRASFWDSRFVNILPKRSAKGSQKQVPNVLTVFRNFTF